MLALFYGWNNVDVPGLDRSHWERQALFDKVSALPKRSIEEVERNLQTNLPAAEDKRPHRRDLVVRRFQRPADWRALIDSRYSYREPKKAIEIYKKVMVYAAYMLGHIDGIAGEVAALVPKAMDALERQPYFKPFFSRLCDELRAMYGTYA